MKDKYSVIYKPKGKAGEYAELAVNPYTGCNHGCLYCYCPTMLRQTRKEFHENIHPKKDYIARLERDIAEMVAAGDRRQVMLSFTTDPYCRLEQELKLTRQTLELFKMFEIPFTVLTKSNRAYEDFGLYTPGRDVFAATFTCIDSEMAAKWEPSAPPPVLRLRQLMLAKRLGLQTWVSLEPVIDCAEAIKVIKQVHGYADMIKIGKLNYHPRAKEIDWREFAFFAIELDDALGQAYMIKDDLKKLMES